MNDAKLQIMMHFTRNRWSELVPDRLAVISELMADDSHISSVIRELSSRHLVSQYYDLICLSVDVWYIFDRQTVYSQRRLAEVSAIEDPISRLMLGMIVQAIIDVKGSRPCDYRSWRLDRPPGDGTRCTPTTHICELNARQFLGDVVHRWEPILHLSENTIQGLIQKKNGSLQSRSRAVLSYIGQLETLPPQVDSHP
jgi:hypothetical protein